MTPQQVREPHNMASSTKSRTSLFFLLLQSLFLNTIMISASSHHSIEHESIGERGAREDADGRVLGRQLLTSFKETQSGGNVTFQCSPSGPCIACLYSEKNDEKYRCSETGYRIPLKCVETIAGSKVENDKKVQKSRSTLEDNYEKMEVQAMSDDTERLTTSIHRNLLDDSSTVKGGSQDYTTYRSCIPAVHEEKLSVLGFEILMVSLLLVSGSVIYLRRRQSAAISGAVRLSTNSRF